MPEVFPVRPERQPSFKDSYIGDINQAEYSLSFRNNNIVQMDTTEQDALFVHFGKVRGKPRHELIWICRVAQGIPERLSRDRPVNNEGPFDRRAMIDSFDTNGFHPEKL